MLDRLSRYYFNKALKNAKEGMISAAIEDLRKSLGYKRSSTDTWKLTGLCFYRLGRLAAAEYCWKRCLYYGETDAAIEEYIKDVRMTAEKVMPYTEEVFMMSLKKKYKKASAVFGKKVIPALKSQADAFNYLGILHMLSGHKRKALKEWKKALQLDCSGASAVQYMTCIGHNGKRKGRGLLQKTFR